MVSAFAKENGLATIVGTETAGRLTPGSGFKVGHGYMLVMPKAAYITWGGKRFEGHEDMVYFQTQSYLGRQRLSPLVVTTS